MKARMLGVRTARAVTRFCRVVFFMSRLLQAQVKAATQSEKAHDEDCVVVATGTMSRIYSASQGIG